MKDPFEEMEQMLDRVAGQMQRVAERVWNQTDPTDDYERDECVKFVMELNDRREAFEKMAMAMKQFFWSAPVLKECSDMEDDGYDAIFGREGA
jgi:hypothetical protein